MAVWRRLVVFLLVFTVMAPIALYRDRLGAHTDTSLPNESFSEDGGSSLKFGNGGGKLSALSQELEIVKEPSGVFPSDASNKATSVSDAMANASRDHKNRVLSAVKDATISNEKGVIQQVTDGVGSHSGNELEKWQNAEHGEEVKEAHSKETESTTRKITDLVLPEKQDPNFGHEDEDRTAQSDQHESPKTPMEKSDANNPVPDLRVRQLRDQLIRARVYLGLGSTRSNPQFMRELRLRVKEVQRVVGDATKDSELPRNTNKKFREMEQTLTKGRKIQVDCSTSIKKLRAILHSTEDQLRVHRKQALFLTQLAAKTLPKGLHCLPLRLSAEYYSLNQSQREFPNQEKLENPELYHYALFSDNVLASAAVVNSTVSNAKDPEKHVFHVVTDRLNYAAMRMWFLASPPEKATVQVQNIEEFTWLNASYSPVLKQLGSASMINYYFRTHHAKSDGNLKFRNPKYLSILNHIRFYLPEIFPKLDKVLFLDDDIVVQKDLTALWNINLKGKVNGAVETCGENFHRFDRYLNFSNPVIAKNFNPRACGWAYGMNVFDLDEWRKQKITEVYHFWQKLNHDRLLWKLGTLPPGLITFYDRTFPLDRSWHVLGLGYNPNVSRKEIEGAAVIHYNGNMKPWLEIGIPKYRSYWTKFLNYDHPYLRDCNINP